MSASEEPEGIALRALESEGSSNESFSDSWTVLDSSHLKDDGDLSDAESVEVLTSEEFPSEYVLSEQRTKKSSTSSIEEEAFSVADVEEVFSAADGIDDLTSAEASVSAEPFVAAATESASFSSSENLPKDKEQKTWVREVLIVLLLELIIELIIYLVYVGAPLPGIDSSMYYWPLKTSKSHQQFEVDPLSLQLSHVLAEWKKRPSEDHSLDRHLLKTLLLYYGESTELSANLHFLTGKVQKHNEVIRSCGKDWDTKDNQNSRLIVSGHLAHSIACILGKHDNDRAVPADVAMTVKSSGESNDFAPEPGFWLNDWHLPQYFKANDTYYRVESKPLPPPMRNLFLHLGSAKWNEYFWALYHRDKKAEGFEEKITENELDEEETERSPLDFNHGDFASDMESSGNVFHAPDSPEDRVGLLHSLFVDDFHLEDTKTQMYFDKKFQGLGENVEKCWSEDCKEPNDFKNLEHENMNEESSKGKMKLSDNNSDEALKKRKPKSRAGKRKHKSARKTDEEKRKVLNEDAQDLGNLDPSQKGKKKVKDNKKKGKRDDSDTLHHGSSVKINEKISREQRKNARKKQADEKLFDWNTRMALGRERLRALGERVDDRLWVFERAKARRDMREEGFSE